MKQQQEPTKKVKLTFTYHLSEDGQLSGETVLPREQTVSGEMEVPVSILKEHFTIKDDGTISAEELNNNYGKKYAGLKFDSVQTLEQVYERYLNYPKEKKQKELEAAWQEDSEKIERFLKGDSPYFSGLSSEEKLLNYLQKYYGDRISAELAQQIEAEINRRVEKATQAKVKLEQEKARKEAEQARIESGTEQWIKEHGSDRLKIMFERGYEYRLTYEIERGNQELSDFVYDREGEIIKMSNRANPSKEALDLETKYQQIYGEDNVKIGWGYAREYDEEMGWYSTDESKSELIWIVPNWSREGFALFV